MLMGKLLKIIAKYYLSYSFSIQMIIKNSFFIVHDLEGGCTHWQVRVTIIFCF